MAVPAESIEIVTQRYYSVITHNNNQ